MFFMPVFLYLPDSERKGLHKKKKPEPCASRYFFYLIMNFIPDLCPINDTILVFFQMILSKKILNTLRKRFRNAETFPKTVYSVNYEQMFYPYYIYEPASMPHESNYNPDFRQTLSAQQSHH